jgi:hypothetical protein
MVSADESEAKVANITPFGLRMQPELKRRVEAAAKANGRSLNSEIVARVERTLQEDSGILESSAHEVRLSTLEGQVLDYFPLTNKLNKKVQELEKRLSDLENRM